MRMVRSKVAGVSFANDDGSSRQSIIRKYCRPGKMLEVRLEPDNRYSDDAMGLWVRGRWLFIFPAGYQVGFIKNEIASQIREDVARGSPISVRILEVTGGGWFQRQYYGVNIEIRVGVGDEFDSQRPRPQARRQPVKAIAAKRESTDSSAREWIRRWSSLRAVAGKLLLAVARGLVCAAHSLKVRFTRLSRSQKTIALGFAACAVGAVVWAVGYSASETVGLFFVLRPTGIVTIIVGLGVACLGTVFHVTESARDPLD